MQAKGLQEICVTFGDIFLTFETIFITFGTIFLTFETIFVTFGTISGPFKDMYWHFGSIFGVILDNPFIQFCCEILLVSTTRRHFVVKYRCGYPLGEILL